MKRRATRTLGWERPHYLTIMLRGGRMTKVAGVAASYAPRLGTLNTGIVLLALGSELSVSGASAGGCTLTGGGGYLCTLPADSAGDTTQTLSNAGGVTATTDPGFGIDTSVNGGDAINLQAGLNGAISFDDQNASDITGQDSGISANLAVQGTTLEVTTTGAVEGGTIGINAVSAGTGDVTVTTTNTGGTGQVTGVTYGVQVDNDNGGAITVQADNVSTTGAGGAAIEANNDVNGTDVTITTTGNVTSTLSQGIYVYNLGSGDVEIDTSNTLGTGSVVGDTGGVTAVNAVSGGMTVTVDTVSTRTGDGLAVRGFGLTDDVVVTANGDVSSVGNEGITVANRGTGDTRLTATNTSGTLQVSGGDNGIYAANYYGGSLYVSVNNVSGAVTDGLSASNDVYGTTLTVQATGTVMGGMIGLDARHDGTGEATLTVNDVTGLNSAGIRARSSQATAHVTVQGFSGDVVGATDGISMTTAGADITVDNLDSVTGNAGDGLDLTSNGGAITVTAVDTILGTGGNGINAQSANGDVSIQSSGLVDGIEGTTGSGIYVRSGTGDINVGGITALGDVTGSVDAINLLNVTGGTGGIVVDTSGGTVTGGTGSGIRAFNYGTGDMSITTDAVNTTTLFGIFGFNTSYSDGDLTVTSTGDITAGSYGILLTQAGEGDFTVDVAGVTSNNGSAVRLTHDGLSDGDLSFTATGAVTGNGATGYGIVISSNADANTYLNVGDVTGAGRGGINVNTASAASGYVTIISDGTISGYSYGVRAYHDGVGALTVSTVDIDTTTTYGIRARTEAANTGGVSVTSTGTIDAYGLGVQFYNGGTGTAVINVNNVNSAIREGVTGTTGASAGDVTVTATGLVDANSGAIQVTNLGVGSLVINANDVNSRYFDGLFALNSSATSTDVEITATGAVTAFSDGVDIRNFGTGATTVDVGSVAATYGYGIFAINGTAATGDVSVTSTGPVSSSNVGVYVRNRGSGDTAITSGSVDSSAYNGIDAYNAATGGSLSIDSSGGTVEGEIGILADQDGTGDLTITVLNVTGRTGAGVFATTTGSNIILQGSSGDIVGATDGVYQRSAGGDITVQNLDSVTGQAGDGIDADSAGGDITISAVDTILGTGGNGILVNAGTGNISIQGVGLVDGVEGTAGDGIYAYTSGTGAIDIGGVTALGDVTGTDNGIDVVHDGTGDATIDTSSGAVNGGDNGISLVSQNGGDLTVTTSDVTAADGGQSGVEVQATGGTSNVAVDTSAGSVSGYTFGVSVINYAGGDTSVTTADVTGRGIAGVGIINGPLAQNVIVDTSAGAVLGDTVGMYIINTGAGDVDVTTADVTGNAGPGIYVVNTNAGSVYVDSSAGAVSGDADGIFVDNQSGAGVEITTGDVTGTLASGINARNQGTAGLTVTARNAAGTAQVIGELDGIYASNANGGALSITADNVTGTTRNGINALNDPSGTSLSVTTYGTVSGDVVGILASNYGTGDLTISASNAAGTALTTGVGGVVGFNQNGGALNIVSDNATAQLDGIYARNDVYGTSLSITALGTTQSDTFGIRAYNYGSGDLTVDAQNASGTAVVTGGQDGINVYNRNGGALDIAVDTVTGTLNDGIYGYNDANGTTASVTVSGGVTGGDEGVELINFGTGGLTITAQNTGGTVQITGGEDGINAYNYNGGGMTIAVDSVTGTTNDGILAINDALGTSLSVTATGTVVGGDEGIDVVNYGTGGVTVTAVNTSGTASVTGYDKGIDASNFNGGALVVTADNATATDEEDAIFALNDASGTSTAITTYGTVMGADNGIFARHFGSGALSVTAYGTTRGLSSVGINVRTGVDSTSASINTTGTVRGGANRAGENGIFARHYGTGSLTIDASNSAGTGSVRGRTNGIFAVNENGGALSIAADDVTGVTQEGIFARTDASSTALSVTVSGDVSGRRNGIDAEHFGSDTLSVTATRGSTVTGDRDNGILAINRGSGDINIATARNTTVTGYDNGIRARNYNDGAVDITVRGDVVGYAAFYRYIGGAIDVANDGSGGLYIATASDTTVYGYEYGIRARNENGGAVEITVQGDVVGNGGYERVGSGIDVSNSSGGTSLSVTNTGSVTSANGDGIQASNSGSGDLTVISSNASGTAQVRSRSTGIRALNGNGGSVRIVADNVNAGSTAIDAVNLNRRESDAVGTGLVIETTGRIFGGSDGIRAFSRGTEPLSIKVAGEVVGDYDAGITADTERDALVIIELNDGADVSGGRYAIFNGDSDSRVYFNDGSKVSGVTQLDLGSDTLTIANADISEATVLNGGDDASTADGFIDVLTFSGFDGAFGAVLRNWEEIVFDNSNAEFSGASITSPSVTLQNSTTFSPSRAGFVLNSGLSIDRTSVFDAGLGGLGNVTLNGDVANQGRVSLIDDTAGDRLTINGDLTGTGALGVDVDVANGAADRVSVEGDANGPGEIDVNGFGETTTPQAITLVDVAGATSETAFSLASSNLTLPGGEDAQVIGAFTYRLALDRATNTFFLMPVVDGGNVHFNPVTSILETYPAHLTRLNALGSTFQSWASRPDVGNGSVARDLFDFDPSPENAIWFSLGGSRSEYEGRSTLNSDVETDVSGFEMGMDFPVFEGQNGRLILGASFAVQEGDTTARGAIASGRINTSANAVTLSATWLSDSRFYAAGQLRYSTFSSDLFLSGVGPVALGNQGEGVAASVEVGQAFALSDRLTLVPQLQVSHSDVSGNGIADPFGSGLAGTITDGETTSVRLGLHAERAVGSGSLFASVSYIHAFDADTAVQFAGFPFVTRPDDNRIEIRAGGELAIGENSTLYGGLTLQGGFSDFGNDNSFGLSGGINVRF